MGKDLYSEADIIQGCQKQERSAQEMLYRRYARKMYGICMSYACNRDLAQDILHDAFIKVFKGLVSFKGEGSLEGWIRRVVTRTALDHLRHQARINHLITNALDDREVEGVAILPQGGMEFKDILGQVSRLPAGARAIFNLYAMEGYTHQDIADALQISVGTSKSQYNRARQLLMKWLKKSA